MIKRLLIATLVASATLLLAGCYSQQQTVTVHEDGRAEMTVVMTFAKDMEAIADMVRARAAIDPRMAILEDGLCASLNGFVPESDNIRIAAREIVSPQSFTCRFDVAINDFPKAVSENGPIAALAGLTADGGRQYRYEMQTMPVALGELAWRSIVESQLKEQGVVATAAQVNDIVAKDKAALRALITMAFRGATSRFTIRAPEIVETNGEVSEERTRVTFRTTISETLDLILEPGKTETPFVVFRY